MQKTLKPSGNGWELYFSKQILKLLGYDPKEVKLLITSDGGSLNIEPVSNPADFPNNMVRGLQKSGGSYGLYMPLDLIEVLGVNPENDYIEMTISNNKLSLRKI